MLHIEEEAHLHRHNFMLLDPLHAQAAAKPHKKTAAISKKLKKKTKAKKEKRWVVINREHPIAAPGWEESGNIF